MESFKKTLRFVVAVLLLAVIYVAVQSRHQEQEALGVADRPDDDIRCCIAIKSTIQSLSSRDVGFSYELLNYYADDNEKEISFARFRDTSVWDSLSRGDIDLIVFDYDDDSTSVKEHADEEGCVMRYWLRKVLPRETVLQNIPESIKNGRFKKFFEQK